jgi:hypothetical protein
MTPPRAATPAGRRATGADARRTPAAPSSRAKGAAPHARQQAPIARPEVRITAKSSRAIAGAARAAVNASAAVAVRNAPAAPRHASSSAVRSGGRTALRPGASSRVAAPSPRAPRRVSRPLGGRVSAAVASAAAVALPQRAPVPLPTPRRRPVPVTRPSRRELPRGARALAWIRALPDHRLLDRLIGGRVWIVLIGTLLVGLVTVQLSLLKLNAGIGRAVERGTALAQSNASLRAEVSILSNSERVSARAVQMGYVMPPQGTPRYRPVSASDAVTALRVMRVPQQGGATSAASTVDATAAPSTTTSTTATDPTAVPDTTTAVTTTPTTVAPVTGDTTATAPGTTPTAPATAAPVTTGSAPAGAVVTAGSTAAAGGATAPTG